MSSQSPSSPEINVLMRCVAVVDVSRRDLEWPLQLPRSWRLVYKWRGHFQTIYALLRWLSRLRIWGCPTQPPAWKAKRAKLQN